MRLDGWLLFLHVVAAAVWLGAGTVLVLLAVLARRTGDETRLMASFEWLGQRIGPPVTLVLAVTGIWMVLRSGAWSFADLWVGGGLAALVLLLVIGLGFHRPQYDRIRAAVAAHDVERTRRLIGGSIVGARVEVVLLLAAFWLMTVKP